MMRWDLSKTKRFSPCPEIPAGAPGLSDPTADGKPGGRGRKRTGAAGGWGNGRGGCSSFVEITRSYALPPPPPRRNAAA